MASPRTFDDVGECVEAALRTVGPRIVLALPLGLGKPVPVVNEFWRRALRDPSIDLTIITALSLRRPVANGELAQRLAGPLVARIFADYEDLDYVRAERAGTVPPNVRIVEFFLEPGAALEVPHAQLNYLSANYTHVARELERRGVNVVAQLLAARGSGGGAGVRYSLGSNPDVTLDLLPYVAARRAAGEPIVVIGQVHPEMPFMPGSAELPAKSFDLVLDHVRYAKALYSPPNPALSLVDHAIGLHASALVRDGGTLQIGIGELGDSICYALLLRHQQNAAWRQALHDAGGERSADAIEALGAREPFAQGLFGATEMFVDQMLDLYRAGVLRRRVYESLPLMRLIASGRLAERFDASILEQLPEVGVGPRLDAAQFEQLQYYGVLRSDCRFEGGRIRTAEGEWIEADLADPSARSALAAQALGSELRNGHLLHAAFFLGPRGFYASLREMPERELRQFDLRGVSQINEIFGEQQPLRVLQRPHARFVNTTMAVTLLGAASSDALESGRVVSGVGGQYNFVAMAHALPGARSILCVRATRLKRGELSSNLVWSHAQPTIPRHLRDVVVTEYGIADLRGRTDAECAAALVRIADSRFQPQLIAAAQRAGKLAKDYELPEACRRNTPEQLRRALGTHLRAGLFSEYPFGTDLTGEEVRLARALRGLELASATRSGRLRLLLAALRSSRPEDGHEACLRRMQLDAPTTMRERMLRRLVSVALRRSEASEERGV